MKQVLSVTTTKVSLILSVFLAITAGFVPLINFHTSANLQREAESLLSPSNSLSSDSPDSPGGESSLDLATDFLSPLIISALSPGYTVNKVTNDGEFIELRNLTGEPFSLSGISLRYTHKGTESTVYDFPDGAIFTGEYLVLRPEKFRASAEADLFYSKIDIYQTSGPLTLYLNGEEIDSVCWTGDDGVCVKGFSGSKQTILTRSDAVSEPSHQTSYDIHFDSENPSLYLPPVIEEPEEVAKPSEDDTDRSAEESAPPHCGGLEFTEVLSYFSVAQSEQFIELYNPTSHSITLDGCQIGYKNKRYPLSGTISADNYFAYYPGKTFSLTKNPSSSNTILLIDADDSVVDELVYPHGQKKSTSYAKFYDEPGEETWSHTFAPTPAAENVLQEFQACPSGKVINPLTGNCVKTTSISSGILADCPEGKYRNPLTGRCKSTSSSSSSTLAPCAEGYERNPETNRCRKIKDNNGAEYALVPTTGGSGKSFVAVGIILLLVALAAVYVVLQFRREIARAARKARQRFHRVLKHLFTRQVSRDGNEEA